MFASGTVDMDHALGCHLVAPLCHSLNLISVILDKLHSIKFTTYLTGLMSYRSCQNTSSQDEARLVAISLLSLKLLIIHPYEFTSSFMGWDIIYL